MYTKLESMRGLAACFVVLYHSPFIFSDTSLSFIANSYLFVDLFFVLSGFVITHAYSERILAGLTLFRFAGLRLARLYPLHLAMLFAYLLFVLVKHYAYLNGFGGPQEFDKNNLGSFIANLLLIHSLGLYNYGTWNIYSWSISVEFYTYVVFFVLITTLDRRKSIIFPAVIATLIYVFVLYINSGQINVIYQFGIFRCLAGFYLGVLIYRLRIKQKYKLRYLNLLECAALLGLITSVSLAHTGVTAQVLVIISLGAAIYVFSQDQSGIFGRILNLSLLACIGRWSYSIYMLHGLFIAIIYSFFLYVIKVSTHDLSGVVTVIANTLLLIVVIVISKYSYQHIEQRFQKILGAHLKKDVMAPPMAKQLNAP